MITVKFDLFKPGSGKWKYGGQVEFSDVFSFHNPSDVYRHIINNQKDVVPETCEQYIMVTDTLDDYTGPYFVKYLFLPTDAVVVRKY